MSTHHHHGKPHGREHEALSHEQLKEFFMSFIERLSSAVTKAKALTDENEALTKQVESLQAQLSEKDTALSAANAGKIDEASVEPLIDALLGPEVDSAPSPDAVQG